MKVYVVEDTYVIYYEGSMTKVVGVFSTKRQALYAMYNAANQLVRDYRSHNGLKFRHGWIYRPCTNFGFDPNYIFAEVDDSESYNFSISEVKLDEVIK
jgi:hypothetical protein